MLIRNKQATGRTQDLTDLELLVRTPQTEGRRHQGAGGH